MPVNLINPVPGSYISDGFGWRGAVPGVVGPMLHNGTDYAAPTGTPVLAAHAGKVSRIWWDTFADGSAAGGNMIKLGAANCATEYAHLSDFACEIGQEFQAGQIIGFVGSTGAASGPHLHFSLLLNGVYVDPVPYIRATTVKKKETMPYRILNMMTTTDHSKPDKTEGKLYFDGGPGVGIKHIVTPKHLELLQRFIADARTEKFYPSEVDIINSYIR